MAENKVGEAKKMAAGAQGAIREFWRKSIEPNLMKWFLILLGILILMLAFLYSLWVWLTSKVVEVSKKVPEVAERVGEEIVTISPPPAPSNIWLYIIGTIFFIFLVYLANKWKDEPKMIGMRPEERKAEARKLIAFLIMLILGSLLLAFAAQLYAVNFHGINLNKNLFFLFIAIGLANLILQPGTGTALVKTFILCSCLTIALSIYGICKGWQPIPKERRMVAAIKEQSCQAELVGPIQNIEEIKTRLEGKKITVEERRDLIEKLEQEEGKCQNIRQFYLGSQEKLKRLKQHYKIEFSPDREDVERNLRRVGIDTAEKYWREFKAEIGYGQTAKLVSVQKDQYIYRSGEIIPGKTPVIFEGVWNEQNQTYRGEWKKVNFSSAKKEKLIAAGGFELEFINGIGKGWWWLGKSQKKYVLKFY